MCNVRHSFPSDMFEFEMSKFLFLFFYNLRNVFYIPHSYPIQSFHYLIGTSTEYLLTRFKYLKVRPESIRKYFFFNCIIIFVFVLIFPKLISKSKSVKALWISVMNIQRLQSWCWNIQLSHLRKRPLIHPITLKVAVVNYSKRRNNN